MEKRILCYGDSNTWGYIPLTGERYDSATRWTQVLARELGEGYAVIEDGLGGRTTVFDDPHVPCRNGREGLPYALLTARPLDLVIVMLGTNDLPHTNAFGYSRGVSELVHRILNAGVFYKDSSKVFRDVPRVLLVSPIRLHPEIDRIMPESGYRGKYPESCRFAEFTRQVAESYSIPWLDAAQYALPSDADGVHMLPEGHQALGKALAQKLRELGWVE